MRLRVASTYDAATGTVTLTVYAVATDLAALGGYSVDLDFFAIGRGGVAPLAISAIQSVGTWDLFSANLSTGVVSGISAFGVQFPVGTGEVPLFKLTFPASADLDTDYQLVIKSTGVDSFFDGAGTSIPYASQSIFLESSTLGVDGVVITSLTLVNPLADIAVGDGTPVSVAVPANIFTDTDPEASRTLTVTTESGDPLPSWLVFDALSRTLSGTPANADIGSYSLRISGVTATGGNASDSFVLRVTGNRPPTGAVTITGTATQGQTLTAGNTLADADGLGAVLYQWQANGADVAGATGSTFTLTQAQVAAVMAIDCVPPSPTAGQRPRSRPGAFQA